MPPLSPNKTKPPVNHLPSFLKPDKSSQPNPRRQRRARCPGGTKAFGCVFGRSWRTRGRFPPSATGAAPSGADSAFLELLKGCPVWKVPDRGGLRRNQPGDPELKVLVGSSFWRALDQFHGMGSSNRCFGSLLDFEMFRVVGWTRHQLHHFCGTWWVHPM